MEKIIVKNKPAFARRLGYLCEEHFTSQPRKIQSKSSVWDEIFAELVRELCSTTLPCTHVYMCSLLIKLPWELAEQYEMCSLHHNLID